jgi:hypothetical protein
MRSYDENGLEHARKGRVNMKDIYILGALSNQALLNTPGRYLFAGGYMQISYLEKCRMDIYLSWIVSKGVFGK